MICENIWGENKTIQLLNDVQVWSYSNWLRMSVSSPHYVHTTGSSTCLSDLALKSKQTGTLQRQTCRSGLQTETSIGCSLGMRGGLRRSGFLTLHHLCSLRVLRPPTTVYRQVSSTDSSKLHMWEYGGLRYSQHSRDPWHNKQLEYRMDGSLSCAASLHISLHCSWRN